MALIPLSKTDPSRLHPDTFDVRTWEVRSEADDDKVGTVHDILLDSDGMPHLLDVNLGVFKKHVLVPLGHAWADASRRVVWIEGLAKQDVERMPDYDSDPDVVTPEFERRLAADYGAAAQGALRRDRAPARVERLARLDTLDDFRISRGSADPRGWTVLGGDGTKLGKVSDLIVDQEAMRVRYLDVDVDEEKVGLEVVDRHVLMPVDCARLEHKGKRVVMDGLFARDLGSYPVYSGLPLAKGVEDQIRRCFRAHAPTDHDWSDRSARRFFGGVRRRGVPADEPVAAPPPKSTRPVMRPLDEPETVTRSSKDARSARDDAARADAASDSTVVRTEEGEEVRIRVSGSDIIIEKHPGRTTDHG